MQPQTNIPINDTQLNRPHSRKIKRAFAHKRRLTSPLQPTLLPSSPPRHPSPSLQAAGAPLATGTHPPLTWHRRTRRHRARCAPHTTPVTRIGDFLFIASHEGPVDLPAPRPPRLARRTAGQTKPKVQVYTHTCLHAQLCCQETQITRLGPYDDQPRGTPGYGSGTRNGEV